MKRRILIVVNSPLFVRQHLIPILLTLTDSYDIFLATNTFSSFGSFPSFVNVIHLPIARDPSFLDIFTFIRFLSIRLSLRPSISLSFTPKGALINALSSIGPGKTIHYFTGQRWTEFTGVRLLFFKIIDRYVIWASSLTFCDSHSQANFLSSSLKCEAPKVIHHGSIAGIDCNKLFPCDIEKVRMLHMLLASNPPLSLNSRFIRLHSTGLIFGFFGRINPDKGIDELVDGFASHIISHPSSLLLVAGPWEYDIPYSRHPLALLPNVIILPCVSDILLFYNSIDCLVLPSYREGFGSVVLEAAACARPSIVTMIPGLSDFVEHGVNGLFVKPHCSRSLSLAFDHVSSEPGKLPLMGKSARDKAISMYSRQMVCKAFLEILLSL
jgi:glycosyltransferase involved in cell wall biosynthesis